MQQWMPQNECGGYRYLSMYFVHVTGIKKKISATLQKNISHAFLLLSVNHPLNILDLYNSVIGRCIRIIDFKIITRRNIFEEGNK